MKPTAQTEAMCTSVFRNASPAGIREAFHQRWIELINRRERERLLPLCGDGRKPCGGQTGLRP